MALLPPLANSARMPATLGVDAHPSFYSSHAGASGAENSHMVLKFHGSGAEENFQKPVVGSVELNGSSDSQEESPLPRVRRKRVVRRYAESSSEDEYRIKTIRRKSRFQYRDSDSSSEGESDYAAARKPELPFGVLRGCPSCRTCQKVVATWRPDAGRRPCIEEAPVFFPSEEEFQHPLRYISSIRARAEPHGICRVVPPPSWKPPCPLRGDSPEAQNMQFPTRVQQVHKLQVRQTTAKECSSTKQTTKKRRGQAAVGRMREPTNFTASPPVNDQPEYFGFWPGEPFLLRAFEKYAEDFKDQYFRISERRRIDPENKWEPTVENIEGEYWRIVEEATEQIEVLYGADVETGTFGSGFPKPSPGSKTSTSYEKSGWNLNNIARYPGSMLSFEEGDISGVLVPWLYIGMCFSSFCWHVEDHHFYSINYMHWGAPKIWYGVPGFAAAKLESAMKKHLPDLFSEQPDLLQKLVTQFSPSFLKQEGVPVYRVVQQPGDFVITFPNAYHSGFNAGFNVAEAVNVAPVDWLPHGQSAVERYRELCRKTSVSHDKLLLGAARVAVKMWWHSQQNEKPSSIRGLAGGLEPDVVCAWQAYCGEGGVLANALKARVNMEHLRRESLYSMAGKTLPLSMKQMDSSYDSTDERECEICKYDLHLSAVGCECCPDKFACLLHGHLLCSCPWSKKALFYRYPLEQLTLLLAAIEGRPGAVATWARQNGLIPIQSPPDVRNGVVPSQIIVGNNAMKMLHSCTSSDAAGSLPNMDFSTVTRMKEMATQYVRGLDKPLSVPKSEPDIPTQPFSSPLVSLKNSAQVASLCGNSSVSQLNNGSVRQESQDLSSHSQKIVYLRSGYAKGFACRNGPEQVGSSKSSVSRLPGGEFLVQTSRKPVSSTSEKHPVNTPSPDIILLSDDEEEVVTCKLNEAAESSFSGHEVQNSLPSRVTECAGDNGAGVQAHRAAESRVGIGTLHPARCAEKLTEGYTSPQESFEAASASGNSSQGATVKEGPVKERLPPALSSACNHPKSMPEQVDGQTASPSPATNAPRVTVVQRGALNARVVPRVARGREKRDVELLEVGRLVIREGWHTKLAIYPAGFRSRICFTNVENILTTCMYVSEIIDRGPGKGPLFQVTHPMKRETYLHESIDGCWHEIQNQINDTIISLRSHNSNLQLPPLLPPPFGVEMFGFTSPLVIEAVEALDPLHQCLDYWSSKQSTIAKPNNGSGSDSAEPDIRRAGTNGAQVKEDAQEPQPLRSLQPRAPQPRIVNTTNSRIPVNIGSTTTTTTTSTTTAATTTTNKLPSQAPENHPAKQGTNLPSSVPVALNARPDTYSTMKGLFQKASPAELRVLYRLFTAETHGPEWGSAFRALTEEVQKNFFDDRRYTTNH